MGSNEIGDCFESIRIVDSRFPLLFRIFSNRFSRIPLHKRGKFLRKTRNKIKEEKFEKK
jgi:hypothetical protein